MQEELKDLKIEELAEGTGRQAMKGDTIAAHYTGWLEDGTKFDSSLDRGEPLEFACGVGMVIKGWDMGVVGMREGQKRRLTIPAHLGYGPGLHSAQRYAHLRSRAREGLLRPD